jgi:hypothetical protein
MKITDLEIGGVYFILEFYDSDLLVPEITTVIFLGEKLLPEDDQPSTLYFQSAEHYTEKGGWECSHTTEEYGVITMQPDFLEFVHDYSELQEELSKMQKGGARHY